MRSGISRLSRRARPRPEARKRSCWRSTISAPPDGSSRCAQGRNGRRETVSQEQLPRGHERAPLRLSPRRTMGAAVHVGFSAPHRGAPTASARASASTCRRTERQGPRIRAGTGSLVLRGVAAFHRVHVAWAPCGLDGEDRRFIQFGDRPPSTDLLPDRRSTGYQRAEPVQTGGCSSAAGSFSRGQTTRARSGDATAGRGREDTFARLFPPLGRVYTGAR